MIRQVDKWHMLLAGVARWLICGFQSTMTQLQTHETRMEAAEVLPMVQDHSVAE